jgi:hypothetical protein
MSLSSAIMRSCGVTTAVGLGDAKSLPANNARRASGLVLISSDLWLHSFNTFYSF